MKIHHIDGSVLFEAEVDSVRKLVEMAISQNKDLRGANLRKADLYYTNLDGADLRGADLYNANLRGVNLRNTNLSNANLCSSDLLNSSLSYADLSKVNLRNADLRGTNLRGAKNAPLVIYGFTWPVYISGFGDMRIGCQFHSIQTWAEFNDLEIQSMDPDALDFWRRYKTMLLSLCETHNHLKNEKSL